MRNRDQASAGAGRAAQGVSGVAALPFGRFFRAIIPAALVALWVSGPAHAAFSFTGHLTQGGYIRGQMPVGAQAAHLGDTRVAIAPDGRFFAAFDRDSAARMSLRVTYGDGREDARTLAIMPRAWSIQHINAPLTGSATPADFWERRKPELDLIAAARARITPATGWQQDFIWPAKGRISGLFGRQRVYRGEAASFHTGIDIAPGAGTPFAAPADGVVVLARNGFSLEGSLIILDHGAGLNSAFLHASKILVSEGDTVRQGQIIGHVGASGRVTGPHLHWSLKWHDARLDPLLFTGPMN
jgi:murein DD-endopeptidase MepM/ murein hydrolase activator NlpD